MLLTYPCYVPTKAPWTPVVLRRVGAHDLAVMILTDEDLKDRFVETLRESPKRTAGSQIDAITLMNTHEFVDFLKRVVENSTAAGQPVKFVVIDPPVRSSNSLWRPIADILQAAEQNGLKSPPALE